MALIDVIRRKRTGTYTVTRALPRDYDTDGKYSRGPTALVVADDVVEAVDADADTLKLTAHGLVTGDGPLRLTGADVPAGLATATDYWVVVVDDDYIQLSSSLEDAMTVVPAVVVVDLTDEGSGTITLVDTASTVRQSKQTIAVPASVQPQSGTDLVDAPEGMAANDIRILWTEIELRTVKGPGTGAGTEPDIIEIDGDHWRCWKIEYFGILSSFYRVTVHRIESP